MKLINGRGQIGELLTPYINDYHEVEVYHTWNFLDKSQDTQDRELNKLKEYLKDAYKKVIFISTSSISNTPYYQCKREAERLVQLHSKNNLIIRFPVIIGKGVFSGLLDKTLKPYGVINYISLQEACAFLLNSIEETGIIECPPWRCSAETLVEIMEFYKR